MKVRTVGTENSYAALFKVMGQVIEDFKRDQKGHKATLRRQRLEFAATICETFALLCVVGRELVLRVHQ